MKDIRAVLAEKETEYKRVQAELTALRYVIKLCSEPSDAPVVDTAESIIDAWPGIAVVEKPKAQFP
jgi:hypothetical protein